MQNRFFQVVNFGKISNQITDLQMTKIKKYTFDAEESVADMVNDCHIPMFFNDGTQFCQDDSINMLSLFSGGGGMDLGFEGKFICHRKSVGDDKWIDQSVSDKWVLLKKLRFNTVFANDIFKEAKLSWLKYMSRFGKSEDIYHFESIVDLVKMHKQGTQIFPKNIDVVTGGFPCQDFSLAGKRQGFDSKKNHDGTVRMSDEPSEETRGKLYYWMKQVVDITKPKMFIAENVKGLVSLGDVKEIIQKDFASADGDGYIVLDPQVLHAGNYGVPETRERVIFIGIRKSALNEKAMQMLSKEFVPSEYNPYPMPTHNFNVNDESLLPPVVCRDVFEGLQEPEHTKDISQMYYSRAKYRGKRLQGQNEINIDGLGPTIRSEHHGNIEYRRLSTEHGGANVEELSQGLPERRLTPRECALIQTFPPDYPCVFNKESGKGFAVSSSGAYKVIGNAVPPMLAYNIAYRIQKIWDLYFGHDGN